MTRTPRKPFHIDEVAEDELTEMFEYLDGLRSTGETNMFGAAPGLELQFGLDSRPARTILSAWMNTYAEGATMESRVKEARR